MIHPSPQLQRAGKWFSAWIIVLVLLIGLSLISGDQAISIALGILLSALLITEQKGIIHV